MEEKKLSRRQLLKRSHVMKYGDIGIILIVELGIIGLGFCLKLPTELTHLDPGNILFIIGICTFAMLGWGLLGYYRDLYDIVHKYTRRGYGVVKKVYKENEVKESSPYKVDIELEDIELQSVMKKLGVNKKSQKNYTPFRQEGTKTFSIYDSILLEGLEVGQRIGYSALGTKDLIVDVQALPTGKSTLAIKEEYDSVDEFVQKRSDEEVAMENNKKSIQRKIESGLFVLGLMVLNGLLFGLFGL